MSFYWAKIGDTALYKGQMYTFQSNDDDHIGRLESFIENMAVSKSKLSTPGYCNIDVTIFS